MKWVALILLVLAIVAFSFSGVLKNKKPTKLNQKILRFSNDVTKAISFLVPILMLFPTGMFSPAIPGYGEITHENESLVAENESLSNQVDEYEKNENNIAMINDAKVVNDGADVGKANRGVAVVDGKTYYDENVISKLAEKDIYYDEKQGAVFTEMTVTMR